VTFAYDRNGNVVSKTTATGVTTYFYDVRDLLVETRVGEQVTSRFAYDGFGRRYLKIGDEGIRQYLYDQTSIVEELTEQNVEVAKYDWGGNNLLSLFRLSEPRRYFHFDGLGTVVALASRAP
jgi:YD repeat-containing protein